MSDSTLVQPMDPNSSAPSNLLSQVPIRTSTPESLPPDTNTQETSQANSSPGRVCPQSPQQASPPSMRRFRSDSHLRDSARRTSQHPNFHGTFSRRRSQDPTLPPLYIPKARPSIAMDILPGTPPTPDIIARPFRDSQTMPCPECATPRPLVPLGQTTTVCLSCLIAFKLCEKHSHRRQSMLTSFPPLLADSITLSEGDTKDQDRIEEGDRKRKLSLVETIGRVIGMLRGGGTQKVQGRKSDSRRGSESSLESRIGCQSGRSTPARPESVISAGASSTR